MKNKFKLALKTFLGMQPKIKISNGYLIERHGSEYGGWTICPEGISAQSIVYSLGIGTDISFDLSLIKRFGLEIHGFDPTPKSIDWVKEQNLPSNFHFHDFGIAEYDGIAKFKYPRNIQNVSFRIDNTMNKTDEYINCKVQKLRTIMNWLGHQQIDLLKMDIEGAEFVVLEDMIKSKIFPKQLLVEFHFGGSRKKINDVEQIIKKLKLNGYKVFNVSPTGNEFSFILDRND